MTNPVRPNIIFIVVDDCGYADLGCTGQTGYRTPALDRLAGEGVRFTQAYANAPLCTNTRVAMITGRYQYRLKLGLVEPLRPANRDEPEMGIPPGCPTLPSLLRTAGRLLPEFSRVHRRAQRELRPRTANSRLKNERPET